jgi:quercetin dioxygenase-like cupin family protein
MQIRDVVKPRRVVTGMNAEGKSYLARVEEIEVVRPGAIGGQPMGGLVPGAGLGAGPRRGGYYRVWATDQLPVPLPTSGLTAPIDLPHLPEEVPEVLRRAAAVGPELGMRAAWVDYADMGAPSDMHWHDSVDIRFVMAGERGQITDGGEEFVWQTGDVLIQNGTNHSHWQFSDNSALIGTVVVGALRVGAYPPAAALHPVQRGPIGGHRVGETRERQQNLHLERHWQAPSPSPGSLRARPDSVVSYEQVTRPRRVISGVNPNGHTYQARAEEALEADYAAALLPQPGSGPLGAYFPIWGCDRLPVFLPTDGLAPPLDSEPSPAETPEAMARSHVLPPPLGFRVAVAKLVPTPQPGAMTWHDSMEVIFVMHGEVAILHDDGSEFTLRPGDTLVQNGTNHAWHVRGDGPCWLGVVSLGGIRYGATPPREQLHAVQRGSGNRTGERHR